MTEDEEELLDWIVPFRIRYPKMLPDEPTHSNAQYGQSKLHEAHKTYLISKMLENQAALMRVKHSMSNFILPHVVESSSLTPPPTELISVQPMNPPESLIFYIKEKYGPKEPVIKEIYGPKEPVTEADIMGRRILDL